MHMGLEWNLKKTAATQRIKTVKLLQMTCIKRCTIDKKDILPRPKIPT